MTKENPQDILGKLRKYGDTRPANKIETWLRESEDVGHLFMATMKLANDNGEQLTPVIDYFKREYGGPPGTTCTVRRAFRSWQKNQIQ